MKDRATEHGAAHVAKARVSAAEAATVETDAVDLPFVAFLPWEPNRQETPCSDHDAREVATALAANNPGKAVHVVRKEHLQLDSTVRPVVYDTYCAPASPPPLSPEVNALNAEDQGVAENPDNGSK